ncbi:MAG: transglycosylase SLT domain-containing protein [Gemmatimonadota bacterium]
MTVALVALLGVLAPGSAGAAPATPFPVLVTIDGAPVVAAACPLYWEPGEPVGIWPHETVAPETRLASASAGAALAMARRWLRAARPSAALERLATAPAGPEEDFLRQAALADLGRWGEFRERTLPPPDGCTPLADRWAALAASAGGDPGAAGRAFERLEATLPELAGYLALWRLEAAALAADVMAGEDAWAELNRRDVPRIVRDDGRALLARLYERAGRYRMARQWHVTLASESRGQERADHLLAAVRVAEMEGDPAAADALRGRVVREIPAAAAELVLDAGTRERLGIDPLEAAHVLRAAGHPDLAEPLATTALESGSDEERREALALRARIRADRGDREGAERDYADLLARWPTDRRVPEILYERARLALRSGDGSAARQRWLDLVARHPDHQLATAALYMAADSYQDDRESDPGLAERAIELFGRVAREHPGSRYADRAYMRAAHLLYALGRYAEAHDRYAAYRGGESSREARYWRARSAERLGNPEAARSTYRALASGEDYYALLARERLAGGPGILRFDGAEYRPGPTPPIGDGAALLADPAGRRAAALLRFGERRYARAELERAVARAWSDRKLLETWAPALTAWGFPDLSLRIGVRLGDDRERLAFPTGFAAAIDTEARAHGLDAWLVLALIRQESLFDAGAVSPAGARGLMQVMPATGRVLAGGMAWAEFDPRMLDVPAVSLHFGATYMDARLREFEAFWPAVLASYNAGPEAVSRWWTFPERTLDPELWVDRIPYRETRDYVKKVLAQYATYRRLHGGGFPAR